MDFESLLSQVRSLGAHEAAIIPVTDVQFDPYFRTMCQTNACGNYGKCWMCPPSAGDIHTLIQEAKRFDRVLVYQTIGKLEDSYDFDGMMEAARKHNLLALKLGKLFASLSFPRKLHLGAGGCHVCPVCAKRSGEPCRNPELAMPSLEVYGINVSELATASGMNYMNGENTVTYFGALLFSEPEMKTRKKE